MAIKVWAFVSFFFACLHLLPFRATHWMPGRLRACRRQMKKQKMSDWRLSFNIPYYLSCDLELSTLTTVTRWVPSINRPSKCTWEIIHFSHYRTIINRGTITNGKILLISGDGDGTIYCLLFVNLIQVDVGKCRKITWSQLEYGSQIEREMMQCEATDVPNTSQFSYFDDGKSFGLR